MGWVAAKRTRRSVQTLRHVLAVEMTVAAQALELRAPLQPGRATGALLQSLRSEIAHLDVDRYLGADLARAATWLQTMQWKDSVESAAGRLA
jgi:histidine ammonia-lyase